MKKVGRISVVFFSILVALGFTGANNAQAATIVNLNTADGFAVLAGSTITNTGSSVINGDLGLSPGTAVTGFPPGSLNGIQHVANTTAVQAKTDLITAYNYAAGQTPVIIVPTELGGTTKTAGVYSSATGTFAINGILTLDAEGDPNAVFIFKTTSTLITGGSSEVKFINGASACNVFWQVGSSATLGTNSTFKGDILAMTSITLTTGANVEGRVLARNGAVTLDTNVITIPICTVPSASTATLHVIKNVVNNDGGTAIASQFNVHVKLGVTEVTGSPASGMASPGKLYTLSAGTYTISEDANSLYARSFSGDCNANGEITLLDGDNKTCTITNDDIGESADLTATINVVKIVINDNGQTKSIDDFDLFVNGTSVNSGETNDFPAPASYTVTEDMDSHYTQRFSGDCSSSGHLSLDPGDHKYCIITNNDIGDPVIIPPVPPHIKVIKTPSPPSLPDGPGQVMYTYKLTNIGTVPVTNITMVGDTCSPLVLTSGDTDNDAQLDVYETWTYTCTTTLTETHTNTVVAHGWANGLSATDIASATVIVGEPTVPPLIHVTKIPSPLTLLAGGGYVTYTETITNPGTIPISDVHLNDDTCAPMVYISGDTNADSNLDMSEMWTYTCRTYLTETTTNIAIASGSANGLTVRDFATATVPVATAVPKLPKTGLPEQYIDESSGDSLIVPGSQEEAVSVLPARLIIPIINVDTVLEHVGLTAEGVVDVPKSFTNAAWLEHGPLPGETGNSIIDGHTGLFKNIPAVFNNLHKLQKGDKIQVVDTKGVTTTFIVRESRLYAPDDDAIDVFVSNDGGAHLNLITCDGVWDSDTNTYSKRLVVFTDKE
jgi:LPXTG-site transpeptidase (sortase) family protein